MRDIVIQIITEILPVVLNIAVTAFAGFLSSKYSKIANNELKKSVVADTVEYIEQVYADIHGKDKLNAAMKKAARVLNEKGIKITDSELNMLIESSVKRMNDGDLKKLIDEVKNGGAE